MTSKFRVGSLALSETYTLRGIEQAWVKVWACMEK
jgi:hypothetical protein